MGGVRAQIPWSPYCCSLNPLVTASGMRSRVSGPGMEQVEDIWIVRYSAILEQVDHLSLTLCLSLENLVT